LIGLGIILVLLFIGSFHWCSCHSSNFAGPTWLTGGWPGDVTAE